MQPEPGRRGSTASPRAVSSGECGSSGAPSRAGAGAVFGAFEGWHVRFNKGFLVLFLEPIVAAIIVMTHFAP